MNFGPANTTEPPGHKPLVVNVIVVGPFEEEEEGTGIVSDLVKVEGEDSATPGPLKRNDPGIVTIPQYRVNKIKQHTHDSSSHKDVITCRTRSMLETGF